MKGGTTCSSTCATRWASRSDRFRTRGSRQTARDNIDRILGTYDSTTDYTRSATGAYVGTRNQLPSLIEQTKVENPFGF